MEMRNNLLRKVVVPLAAIIIFLVIWEWIVWINGWPNYKMASPSDLGPAFWKYRVLFLEYGWDTFWRTVAGLGLSVLVGTMLGMIMGFSRIIREGLYPLLVGFNAIPKATVVPVIALILVGLDDLNTVLIAFLISFFRLPSRFQSAYPPLNRNTATFYVPLVPQDLPSFGK